MERPMAAFLTFSRENSKNWRQRFDCQEAGPRPPLQAFPRRVA